MCASIRFAIVLGTGLLVSACNPPTAAEFFLVNTIVDTIDASVGDGVCADAGGNCSLRAAVMEANANPNLTEIQLTGGETYTLSIAGRSEDAALTGDLDLLAHTYIRANVGSGQATIDAAGLDRAIHTVAGALHFLEGLILTGGAADNENGGALLIDSAMVAVEDTRITDNSAANGGGVYVSGGTLAMEDSTVDGNTASNYGGGLDIRSNAVLYQSTVTGNASGILNSQIAVDITGSGQLDLLVSTVDGGAFALDLYQGNAVILRSIISAQTQVCQVERSFGTATSLGFNVASDTSCGLTAAGDQQNVDPRLRPLADNGGPIPTMLLGAGSPALDTHPCPDTTAPDARQQSRPSGAACDTGAIEAQPDEVLGVDCTTPPNLVPGAQLKNCDLNGIGLFQPPFDLQGADLTGANLTDAYLEEANLSNANLASANLTGAQLGIANLSNANLTNANLTDADLFGANLTSADLTGANLTGTISGNIVGSPKLAVQWQMANGYFIGPGAHLVNAYLGGADLTGADLTGANLTGVISGGIVGSPTLPASWQVVKGYLIGPGANLTGANLTDADLTGANLTGANLTGANLAGAHLNRTRLTGANLAGIRSGGLSGYPRLSSDWQKIKGYLIGPGADLSGVNLSGVDLTNYAYIDNPATTVRTNLSGANLNGANLSGAKLIDGGSFEGADLTGADLTNVNFIRNVIFTSADLTGVDFTGADLLSADFSGATLTRVDFSGANLAGVNLYGANLTNAKLTHIDSNNLSDLTSGGIVGTEPLLPERWRIVNGYLIAPNVDLSFAELAGTDLSFIDAQNATFAGADLTGANLEFSNFNQALFFDVDGNNAIVKDTVWFEAICPNGRRADIQLQYTCTSTLF